MARVKGSLPFDWQTDDTLKFLKGCAIAAAGAVVAYAGVYEFDLTTAQGILTAAAASAVVNGLRKWIMNTTH